MELLQELLFTAAISLIFAFFLAKLISVASSSSSSSDLDLDLSTEALLSNVDLSPFSVSPDAILSQPQPPTASQSPPPSSDLHFQIPAAVDPPLTNQEPPSSPPARSNDVSAVAEFEEGSSAVDFKSMVASIPCGPDRVFASESCAEETVGIEAGVAVGPVAAEEQQTPQSEREVGLESTEKEAEESCDDGPETLNLSPSCGGLVADGTEVPSDPDLAEDGAETAGVLRKEDGEKGSSFNDSGDEEWEGIEKSELGKQFEAMASIVNTGGGDLLSKLNGDVQMQLYGLHKVAMEGPCHEPQPSVLKVSARTKWHAWQRLGNMDPEVAMEQYIHLLSSNIPRGVEEEPEDNERHKETNDTLDCGSKAPDIISSPQCLSSETERVLEEVHPCITKIDAVGHPKLKNKDIH